MRGRPFDFTIKVSEVRPPTVVFSASFSNYQYYQNIQFTLKVCGKYDKSGDENQNERVTSGQLVWEPVGNQAEIMDVKPVFDDITIAKIK